MWEKERGIVKLLVLGVGRRVKTVDFWSWPLREEGAQPAIIIPSVLLGEREGSGL